MTQPTIDPTDLYFVTAGLDPSMSPQALNARLSGQLMTLDAMVRQGQSVNPAHRSRVLLARDILGFLGPKQQYDAARLAGRRPTDEELVAMTQAPIRQSMRAAKSSWASPSMLAGYAIFGVIILVAVVFGVASCGSDDDSSPAATPGTASTAASASETAPASPLEQLENGAPFEVVRTIDLKALAPDVDSGFWDDRELIHGPNDTVELWWSTSSHSMDDLALTLAIDADGTAKVVQSKRGTSVYALTERRTEVEGAGSTGVRVSRTQGSPESLHAIALNDGRIFGYDFNEVKGARGLLYEIKVAS
ncbi:hypothetical protein WKY82_12835 [Gordonia malaquae]|uniref:hypothetical protein n=1 Tax=Gordonia malaquae TaxID=410332 RepID=UPI0030C79B12